jgi:N6-adenosine-specific RNA methylase IME4
VTYRTIVADPPWDHSDGMGYSKTHGYGRTRRPRENGATLTYDLPYPTMTVDEVKALPVNELAADDAHLYLWTTNRYLRDVWDVAEAWGFVGSSLQTWCKTPNAAPLGGAFRSNVEFFLFARRGSLPTIGYSNTRWFHWKRRVGPPVAVGQKRRTMHSAKPEAFLDLVESLSPGPYLELFARRQRLGWDTWGNEALEHVDMGAAV